MLYEVKYPSKSGYEVVKKILAVSIEDAKLIAKIRDNDVDTNKCEVSVIVEPILGINSLPSYPMGGAWL